MTGLRWAPRPIRLICDQAKSIGGVCGPLYAENNSLIEPSTFTHPAINARGVLFVAASQEKARQIAGLGKTGEHLADLQAALFRAVQANDLAEARRLNNRIYPFASVFYADPWADMHNRMNEALVLLGRLPRAVVRPPLVKLARPETDCIRVALVKAGLLSAKTARDAA
jgi:hypothetical protein